MTKTIVIGAGVMGASVAYRLAGGGGREPQSQGSPAGSF
jgi:glycine/D-amino acid oxidase-like deaminating enzyme